MLALALVAAGLGAVWLEIGRPLRAIHVFFNPCTSWMTREVLRRGGSVRIRTCAPGCAASRGRSSPRRSRRLRSSTARRASCGRRRAFRRGARPKWCRWCSRPRSPRAPASGRCCSTPDSFALALFVAALIGRAAGVVGIPRGARSSPPSRAALDPRGQGADPDRAPLVPLALVAGRDLRCRRPRCSPRSRLSLTGWWFKFVLVTRAALQPGIRAAAAAGARHTLGRQGT